MFSYYFQLKLDQTSPNNQSVTNLPGDNEKITCHYLTQDFLVYGTDVSLSFIVMFEFFKIFIM